jgi:uncharacterized protein (DUF2252 family)
MDLMESTAVRGAATARPQDRTERGRAARSEVPRSSHARWKAPSARPDPVALLEEQAASRVPELVPIRYGRMAASPFAFYRGGAYVMASDLSATPRSGIRVQLCGDAHLSNFGGFASPERELVFDLNDFDETLRGPWEWDVKRLAASIDVAGRQRGHRARDRHAAVRGAVAQYREAMHEFAVMSSLEVWYARLDEREIARFRSQAHAAVRKRYDKGVAKAKAKDSSRAFSKLAHHVDGGARIVADPPLIVPIADLLPEAEAHEFVEGMRGLIRGYSASLSGDLRRLVGRYSFEDLAHKVVGVGSVGTRAWVLLMVCRDSGDPLFLQAKEAGRSVLEPFAGRSEYRNQGRRVVEGQRLMQAASDIFLGWLRTPGIDGKQRDFYVRQLWDWKASADVEAMDPDTMAQYAKFCGWTLARGHARSGDAIAIAGYLGRGEGFDRAITEFADSYADQNEADYRAFMDAIDSGRIRAAAGI